MNKEEFFIKWRNPQFADLNLMKSDLDSVISEAIADYEAKAWKKYPENKPEMMMNCWVTISGRKDVTVMVYSDDEGFGFPDNFITAWMPYELPEPYREGGQND